MEEPVSGGFLRQHRLTWLLLGSLLVVRLISMGMAPYFDTTEARYGEIARKMLDMNDWITPWFDHGEPYWGKPPFAFWLTALGFKAFGVNEFAGRLPHLLIALAVAGLVGWLAARRDRDAFVAAVALLFGAFLYFVLAGAVMVDVEYTLAFTMTMTGFWLAMEDRERTPHAVDWLASAFFFGGLALGLLSRGPIAVVLPGITLTLWTVWHRRALDAWERLPWLSGLLTTVALALPWYILAERLTPGFLRYFIVGEHFGRFLEPGWSGDRYGFAHKEPIGTIWIYAILGTLPWSIIVPVGWWRWRAAKSPSTNETVSDRNINSAERAWRDYLLLWALIPLLFFTPARNVMIAYVMPALPAFALLTVRWMMQIKYRHTTIRLLNIGLVFDLLLSIALLRVTMFPEALAYRTEKYLVHSYQTAAVNTAGSSAIPLIYVGRRPFSGGFYTGAHATRVDSPDQILPLAGKEAAYVATTNPQAVITWFEDYNATDVTGNAKRSLKLIGRYGNRSLILLEKTTS